MKMKKILAIMLVLAMTVSVLAGCSSSPKETTPAGTTAEPVTGTAGENEPVSTEAGDPGALNVAINSVVTSLSPFIAAQNGYNYVKSYVYETLGEFSFAGDAFQGVIAKSWENTDGAGYEYDVVIYDNVTDSQGNVITAEDVAWCCNMVMEAGTNPWASPATVESVEAVDATTVHVVLKSNAVGGLEALMRAVIIVSKAAYEASPDAMATTPVGTGRYVVTDFKSDSSIKFERREDYWQTDESLLADISQANVSEINIQEITETSQMAVALQTNTVDIAAGINAVSAQMFMNDSNYNVFSTPAKLGMQLYFSGDAHSPLASSKELRQAISYAINMDAVIASVYNGYGSAQYVFGTDQVPDFLEKWKSEDYYGYNPDKAKELLKEAGYSEGELTLSLMAVNDDMFVKYAEVIQSCLMAVGINVEINAYEGALYMASFMDGSQYDLMLNNVTGNFIVQIWNGKLNQGNYNGVTLSGFKDDELQKLLETCNRIDGHTEENIDACWQYIKETNYVYSMGSAETFAIANANANVATPRFDNLGNMNIAGSIYTK